MHIIVSHKDDTKIFLPTKDIGKHKEWLQSFKLALRNTGTQHCNIVNVSSIIPPGLQANLQRKGLKNA